MKGQCCNNNKKAAAAAVYSVLHIPGLGTDRAVSLVMGGRREQELMLLVSPIPRQCVE